MKEKEPLSIRLETKRKEVVKMCRQGKGGRSNDRRRGYKNKIKEE